MYVCQEGVDAAEKFFLNARQLAEQFCANTPKNSEIVFCSQPGQPNRPKNTRAKQIIIFFCSQAKPLSRKTYAKEKNLKSPDSAGLLLLFVKFINHFQF